MSECFCSRAALRQALLTALCALTLILLVFAGDESRTPYTVTGEALEREAGTPEGTDVTIGAETGYAGTWLSTQNFLLDKGAYRIGIAYRTDTASHTLSVYDNGVTTVLATLQPGVTYAEYPVTLSKGSQDLVFSIDYSGQGTLTVSSITLYPETRFYRDAFFYAALIVLAALLWFVGARLCACGRLRAPSPLSRAIALTLLLTGLAAFLPYANSYLAFGDDLCYHLIRIEGIRDGLADGQFPVVLYPEGVKGYGYLNCMYPSLFLYLPALLRLAGVSLAGSYKFLILLFHLATPAVTYGSVKSVCGSRKAALLAAVLYTLCPYRLTNFYARGALGEALAMTFFPLLFAGLYHLLLGDLRRSPLLVLGLSGLVQTHVLSSLIGVIFCVLFGVLCIRQLADRRRLSALALSALLTVLLNLWFLTPFLTFYLSGSLHTSALDWATFAEYSLNFSGLFGSVGASDLRVLSLGLPLGICGGISLLYFLLERAPARADAPESVPESTLESVSRPPVFLAGFLLVLGGVCTLMVVNQFPAWALMKVGLYDRFFKNMQFAWRMLGPASVCLSLSGSILLYQSRLLAPYRRALSLGLILLALLSAVHYQSEDFAYSDYEAASSIGHASKLNGIPKGKNTTVYPYEWMPADFPGSLADAECAPVFTQPDAVSEAAFRRVGTTSQLTCRCSRENVYALLPLAAYPGYEAFDETGTALPLLENTDRLVAVPLASDGQLHTATVSYRPPVSFFVSFLISALTALGCVVLAVRGRRGAAKQTCAP